MSIYFNLMPAQCLHFDKLSASSLRLTARTVILLRRRQAYGDRWSLSKYVR